MFFGNIFFEFLNIFEIRFTQEDLSSGRFQLQYTYIKGIIDNIKYLIIGFGLNQQGYFSRLSVSSVPHNIFYEIIYTFGFVGLALWSYLTIALLRKKSLNWYSSGITILPLFILLLLKFA